MQFDARARLVYDKVYILHVYGVNDHSTPVKLGIYKRNVCIYFIL